MKPKTKEADIAEQVASEEDRGVSCSRCNRKSTRYNGWTNYETWTTALWIDNGQTTYKRWRDLAAGIFDHAQTHHEKFNTPKEEAIYRLSQRLKEEVTDDAPNLPASLYSDLLNAALSEVCWYEIAKNVLEEAQRE